MLPSNPFLFSTVLSQMHANHSTRLMCHAATMAVAATATITALNEFKSTPMPRAHEQPIWHVYTVILADCFCWVLRCLCQLRPIYFKSHLMLLGMLLLFRWMTEKSDLGHEK